MDITVVLMTIEIAIIIKSLMIMDTTTIEKHAKDLIENQHIRTMGRMELTERMINMIDVVMIVDMTDDIDKL